MKQTILNGTRTEKRNIINDNSKSNYDATNQIIYNREILKSNLCDYNSSYILLRGDITVVAAPATQAAFKNCAPFTKCITKIDETIIDDAKDLDLAILMYNLIEYVQIILQQQETCGFILRMKLVILMQILLMMNLSSIRLIKKQSY